MPRVFTGPKSPENAIYDNIIPMPSMVKVTAATERRIDKRFLLDGRLNASWARRRPPIETLPFVRRMTITPIEVMPNPPICINKTRTTVPNVEKVAAISTVASPVTHTALVEINRPSRKSTPLPLQLETGSDRSMPPIIMTVKKPMTMVLLGCFRISLLILTIRRI